MEVESVRGLIVEKDDDYLIVVNRKGDFKKILINSKDNFQIGDEIQIPDRTFYLDKLKMLAKKTLPAAAILLCFITIGILNYFSPITYVSIDINPSIELEINKYDRVINVKDLNYDAKKFLEEYKGSLRNIKSQDAVKKILTEAANKKYLNKKTDTVMIAVSSKNDRTSEELSSKLKSVAKSQLDSLSEQYEKALSKDEIGEKKNYYNLIVEETPIQKHNEAREKNISQGRLLLYDKAKKIKPNTTLSEIEKSSISKIVRELKESNDKSKSKEQTLENKIKHKKWNINKGNKIKKNNNKNKEKNLKQDTKKAPKNIKKLQKEQIKNKTKLNGKMIKTKNDKTRKKENKKKQDDSKSKFKKSKSNKKPKKSQRPNNFKNKTIKLKRFNKP